MLLNLADGHYYALDEVGSRIWNLCDGACSVSDVVSLLADEYDAPVERLADLVDAHLVVEAS